MWLVQLFHNRLFERVVDDVGDGYPIFFRKSMMDPDKESATFLAAPVGDTLQKSGEVKIEYRHNISVLDERYTGIDDKFIVFLSPNGKFF